MAPAEPVGLTPATPLQAVSVADAAAEHLRRLLFSGSLQPGEELRDTVVAKELGIARPTARIAVQRLVAEGLLEREPGHSARLRSFSRDDVKDIFGVRRLLEFEAVRRIVADGRSTAGIAESLERFDRAGEAWEAGPDADAEFHTAVVAAAGSPRLARMFAGVTGEMRLLTGLLRKRYASLAELSQEHTVLLRVLRSGDEAAAIGVWEDHVADAERFLLGAVGGS